MSKEEVKESVEEKKKITKASTGKRKFHLKSRNGCLTCKKRRIKCDETRPICQRCQHMKLVCGYTLGDGGLDQERGGDTNGKRRRVSGSEYTSGDDSFRGHKKSASSDSGVSVSGGESESDASRRNVRASSVPKAAENLLTAGNLNNLNLSHLVNNLSSLGGNISSLGSLASLSNLATLAQLPIELSNLGSLIDSQIHNSVTSSMGDNMLDPLAQENERKGEKSLFGFEPAGEDEKSLAGAASSGAGAYPSGAAGMSGTLPNISPNVNTLRSGLSSNPLNLLLSGLSSTNLNMLDLRLMFHYTSHVSNTITSAGISDTKIWNYDIPMLAFDYPFLMHSILAFSATHLSRTEKGLDQCVTCHRGDALRLLREAVLNISSDNTDALVASALILIMDSLANASFPLSTSPKSLPASAWIFHVKGAATILTAVWPLTEASRFYKFISVDLGDLGDIINQRINLNPSSISENDKFFTNLECHDRDIADLYPVGIDSPYLITLAYLNKLHKERYKSDFILRIFAFPALLDKSFLSLLMSGDVKAMRIMRSYYKLLRSFTAEMKDKVWFLEGVSQVLPVDVEEYAGGAGGMHMMLDFLGGGPSIINNEIDEEIRKIDPSGTLSNHLTDTNNLPSDITSNLDVMQGDSALMNIK